MIKNVKAITTSSYLSMFFLGVASALIGAAARNIGLSPYQIGLMIAVQNVGFAISVSLSGVLSDTYEKPKILLIGSLLLAGSFLTFYLSQVFWVNLIIMLLIGAGIGTYEGVTDAMLLDLHTQRASLYINVNHFFVQLGSIIIALYLIFLEMNWRLSIVQAGIAVLVLAVFFTFIKLTTRDRKSESYRERFNVLIREKTVAILFVAIIIAVGVEVGTTGILTTFLAELRGFSTLASKLGLIVFFSGMATGRVLIGFFTQKQQQIPHYILALFGLSTLLFTGLYLLDLGGFNYVVMYLTGMSISALLPLMVTLAGLRYPEMSGTVMGAVKVAIPVGGILLPFLMSMTAQSASLQISLLVFPAAFLVGFFLLLGTGQLQPSRAAAPTPTSTATNGR